MGIQERKMREKEARVKQILDAANKVFAKKGFATATVDEIATFCELSKASIYLYFKSKDDLLFSITEPALSKFEKRISKIANNKQESADKTLIKIFMEAFALYKKNHEAFQIFWRYNIKLLPKDKRDRLENIIRCNMSHIEKTLQKGIDQGIFRRVDQKVTATILWSLYMGVYHHQSLRMLGKISDYRKSTILESVELVLRGLLK